MPVAKEYGQLKIIFRDRNPPVLPSCPDLYAGLQSLRLQRSTAMDLAGGPSAMQSSPERRHRPVNIIIGAGQMASSRQMSQGHSPLGSRATRAG